jgi:chromosome segregation ATPase
MARPSKPAAVIAAEKKSHRTKAEMKAREEGEKALMTGFTLKERPEVAKNEVAHAEFVRLNEILNGIGKNDAIYEAVINRYCMITAECVEMELKRERMSDTALKIEKELDEIGKLGADADMDTFRKVACSLTDIYKTILGVDKQIDAKRKMLLSIEKENILTIAAALRSIPKTPDTTENPLLKALQDTDDD